METMRDKQPYFVKSDYGIYDTDVVPTTQKINIVGAVSIDTPAVTAVEGVDQASAENAELVLQKNDLTSTK